MPATSSTPYDHAYYAQFRDTGRQSADLIAALVADRYQPNSVIDVGCGEGYFLDAFRAEGATDTLGADGPFNDGALVRGHGHEFATIDLNTEALAPGRTFDLAVCLEVAEHLQPARSHELVAQLVAAAPVVLFSAAIPLQPGAGHINLHPQSYWIEMFAALGYRAGDFIRPQVWDDERVSPWYRQNVLVYSPRESGDVRFADVVHPGILRMCVQNARPKGARAGVRLIAGSVARRLGR